MNKLSFKLKNDFKFSNFKLSRKVFKESWLFVVFWFINGLMPISICLISATIKDYGSYYVIGIGYIAAFQLAYVQIGWSLAISVLFVVYKIRITDKISNADYGKLLFNCLMIIGSFAIILIIFFIVPTIVYNRFANNHSNTILSQKIGYMYIAGLLPYIFCSLLISLFIVDIHIYKGNHFSIPALIISNGLMLLLSYCSTLLPINNYEIKGLMISLSISIGAIISAVVLGFISYKYGSFNHLKFIFDWEKYKFMFKSIFSHAASLLSIQIIKGIALFILGIVITDTMNMIVPMGYQLSRVIWYNFLYFIPFFAYGISDTVMFLGLRNRIEIKKENLLKNLLLIAFLTLFIEIVIASSFYFLVEPVSSVYVRHHKIDYNYIDLNSINLEFILNKLANKYNLSQERINSILKLANDSPIMERLIKRSLIDILSNNNMTAAGTASYLIKPDSNAYFYISTFAVLYPCSLVFANYRFVFKKRYQNWSEALTLIGLQIIVITSIVTMGVKCQSSTQFPYLNAWSFPLTIIGPLAFILYVTRFSIHYHKFINDPIIVNSNKIVLNEWNNTNQVIYA